MGGLEKKAFSFGATPEGYCSHKCFFFLWSTYGTHRTVWQKRLELDSSSLTVHKSLRESRSSARSHIERVRDKPGNTLQDKMLCAAKAKDYSDTDVSIQHHNASPKIFIKLTVGESCQNSRSIERCSQ